MPRKPLLVLKVDTLTLYEKSKLAADDFEVGLPDVFLLNWQFYPDGRMVYRGLCVQG